MTRLLLICSVLATAAIAEAQQSPVFYSYQTDRGRTVYVNRFSMVPPEKRAGARAVDLSRVDLHEDLAEDIADAVGEEIRFLKDSDPCMEALEEDKAGAWRHIWKRHGPWVLASFAAMVLVLMTPWMVMRTPPGVWSRLLMVALPALAMTALLAISATRAASSLEAVGELAKLCEANEKEASPRKQLVRLTEMHAYIAQLYRDRYADIERLSEIE